MVDHAWDYMDMATADSKNTYKDSRKTSYILFVAALAVLSVLICILGIVKQIKKKAGKFVNV